MQCCSGFKIRLSLAPWAPPALAPPPLLPPLFLVPLSRASRLDGFEGATCIVGSRVHQGERMLWGTAAVRLTACAKSLRGPPPRQAGNLGPSQRALWLVGTTTPQLVRPSLQHYRRCSKDSKSSQVLRCQRARARAAASGRRRRRQRLLIWDECGIKGAEQGRDRRHISGGRAATEVWLQTVGGWVLLLFLPPAPLCCCSCLPLAPLSLSDSALQCTQRR